jgi:formate dehydrogenase iron-sulfur subunit
MSLPLHELASSGTPSSFVRLTEQSAGADSQGGGDKPLASMLIPARPLEPGEQYRFHFDMTRCIGCRSCEVACNEQNGNPADINWRRVGEIEGGTWPHTNRYYLSMGCNHCLSADCLRGCPVNAYTKDPLTGIVLHSAEACIGCQYCVWNCPYSVPQFNAERGVVGKCDMCHGRLTAGREPACVNACPENAIQIEIVDQLGWRCDHATADAPGMPNASQTISTTRITLPAATDSPLEKVDIETLRPEHAHWSLVWMTSLIQLSVGVFVMAVITGHADPMLLTLVLALTVFTLNISVFHLGRPAYAWRALKMWRRSWLSREVLLFSLFFLSLTTLTAISWLRATHLLTITNVLFVFGQALTSIIGIAGILASARIYLVPARPAWNMRHTPIDFLLSSAVLGVTALPSLSRVTSAISHLPWLTHALASGSMPHLPRLVPIGVVVLWMLNHIFRTVVLYHSSLYERRASASLLNTEGLRGTFLVSFAFLGLALFFVLTGQSLLAVLAAFSAVVAARYLFFVSVVPLNMALTYIRQAHA